MYKSKLKIAVPVLIISAGILLSGCAGSPRTDFPSISPTVVPSALPSTVTAEPIRESVVTKCVELTQTDLPHLQGTLILEHTLEYDLKEILFWETETQQEHFISKQGGEYYSNEAVSPAGTYFSAETSTFSSNGKHQQGPILIFDSDANLAATIELKQESYGVTWLNEQQVLINEPFLLLSPFEHTQKEIQSFLPNYFSSTDILYDWNFYGYHKNVYDPQMTRMLYPLRDENGVPNVALRDLEKGIDLASFPTSYGYGTSPTWASDGEKLAIALNTVPSDLFQKNDNIQFEIFGFSRNGEKLFTTTLTSSSETVYITNLSWSPNGRYIAFWYTHDKNRLHSHLQLAVLDTETQSITLYCINSGDDYIRFSPIWAPSSDYLLVAYKIANDEALSSLLINMQSGKAWIIKSQFEPLGWLK
jgi:dipeptidyl aminopeptidase/acylaminoacyl peptidase